MMLVLMTALTTALAKESDKVAAVVTDAVMIVLMTAPANQKTVLESQRILPVNLATTTVDDTKVAEEAANHEKMMMLPPKHQQILSLDATFAMASAVVMMLVLMSALTAPAKEGDMVAAVVMIALMTAPANQKTVLESQRILPVNLATVTTVDDTTVAEEAANHEKMTMLPQKHQLILNLD